MIKLIHRIVEAAGKRKLRIRLAYIFCFIKGFLMKSPVIVAFVVIDRFLQGTDVTDLFMKASIAMAAILLLQIFAQYIGDRLHPVKRRLAPSMTSKNLMRPIHFSRIFHFFIFQCS